MQIHSLHLLGNWEQEEELGEGVSKYAYLNIYFFCYFVTLSRSSHFGPTVLLLLLVLTVTLLLGKLLLYISLLYLVASRKYLDNLYKVATNPNSALSQSEIINLIGKLNQALSLQQKRAGPHWGHMWH